MPNCEKVLTLKGHNDKVGGVAFHPEATISQEKSALNLASSGADGLIQLWNLERYKIIGKYAHRGEKN